MLVSVAQTSCAAAPRSDLHPQPAAQPGCSMQLIPLPHAHFCLQLSVLCPVPAARSTLGLSVIRRLLQLKQFPADLSRDFPVPGTELLLLLRPHPAMGMRFVWVQGQQQKKATMIHQGGLQGRMLQCALLLAQWSQGPWGSWNSA